MSLFSDLKPVKHNSRNVFDRSRSETFSTKLGILTPCFVEHTIPQGKYKINVSDIVRVSEQQTANFVGMNQNVEFAFVPYSQLWHDFNRMYYGKGEQTRNLNPERSPLQPLYTPQFQILGVFSELISSCLAFSWFDTQKKRLYDSSNSDGGLLPDNMINFGYDTGVIMPDGMDFHDTPHIDVHGRFCGFDQMRVLDMLGYGNILPFYKFAHPGFDEYEDEVEGQVYKTLPIVNDPDDITEEFVSDLGTRIAEAVDSVVDNLPTGYRNSFAIQAYLKFFSDVYRNKEYDSYNYSDLYNCDFWVGSSVGATYSTGQICQMIKPWYRQYKKDLFTGLYPNAQFGDVAVAVLNNPSSIRNLGTNPAGSVAISANASGNYLYSSGATASATSWQINSSVSSLAIRQAEALQRFKEALVRAGNREKDLQRSVFGVGSRYIEDCYVDFLGSYATPVQQTPVAATTQNIEAQQNIGDLGAYSSAGIQMGQQKEIEFEAYDFGIIIGFVYVLPETKYEAFGVDAHNIKFRSEDYYNPFYQNLGLAPVYSYLNNQFGLGSQSPSTTVLGYLSRYYEYKTCINRVHGEFYGSNPCNPYDELDLTALGGSDPSVFFKAAQGAFSPFVAPRDVRESSVGTLQMLYVDPKDADMIFHLNDEPYQDHDHFKFEMTFRVKAILPMSVTGLPQ